MKKLLYLIMFIPVLGFGATKITSYTPNSVEKWDITPDVQFSTGTNRGSIFMNLEVLEEGTTVYIDEANRYFKQGENTTKIINTNKNMEPKKGVASYFKMYIRIIVEYYE